MTMDKATDDLTQEIFLALVRASNSDEAYIRKDNSYKKVRYTSLPPIARFKKSKEVSFFKSDNCKELISILGMKENQETMEIKLFTEFIENKSKHEINTKNDRDFWTKLNTFNPEARITSSKECLEEKSIIVRMIYALMGINPYRNFDTDLDESMRRAFLQIDFEAGKLMNHMQQAIEKSKFTNWKPLGRDWDRLLFIITRQYMLIKDARKVIRSKFMTMFTAGSEAWPYMNETKLLHKLSSKMPIKLVHVLNVWGGTYKAYKNEEKKSNFPATFEYDFYDSEAIVDRLMVFDDYKKKEDKELALDHGDAQSFLKSKGISCDYISNQRPFDHYWGTFEDLFKKMGGNITIRNAKKVLSSNTQNISANSK